MLASSLLLWSFFFSCCSALCVSTECEDQADLTSLLQTTVKKSPADELAMTHASEMTREDWCWFWDSACRARRRARWAEALIKCKPGAENGPVTEGVEESGSLQLETVMQGMVTKEETYVTCLEQHGAEYSAIRHAEFKASIMTKVVKMLSPAFHKQLANADLGLVGLAQSGSKAVAQLAAKGIATIDWLEYVIWSKVTLAVQDAIKKIKAALLPSMWSVVGVAEQSVEGALVVELGTIPLVGGVLAEIASKTVSVVYQRLKEGVSLSISKLFDKIANETIAAIVSEACKPLQDVKAGILKISDVVITDSDTLQKVGLAVAEKIGSKVQADSAMQAAEGEAESAGLKSSILAMAKDDANDIATHEKEEKGKEKEPPS